MAKTCRVRLGMQSRATFFRHSGAVLFRKLPDSFHDPAIPTERISKCAEAFTCEFTDGYQ